MMANHHLSLYSSLSLCCYHSLEGKLFVGLIFVLGLRLVLLMNGTICWCRVSLCTLCCRARINSDSIVDCRALCSLSITGALSLTDALSLTQMLSLSWMLSLSRGCSLSLSLTRMLSLSLADAISILHGCYLSLSYTDALSLSLSHGCSLSLDRSHDQ
jgi:hypothetical protein